MPVSPRPQTLPLPAPPQPEARRLTDEERAVVLDALDEGLDLLDAALALFTLRLAACNQHPCTQIR